MTDAGVNISLVDFIFAFASRFTKIKTPRSCLNLDLMSKDMTEVSEFRYLK